MAFTRKKYSGPMKDRGTVTRGGKKLANVSKEELDDFRAKYGKDKTLRDFLNADRSGKPPEPTVKYRGTQEGDERTGGEASARRTPSVRDKIDPKMAVDYNRGMAAMEKRKRDEEKNSASGGYSPFKKGGTVKKGRRGDGCAMRGKTKGRMC